MNENEDPSQNPVTPVAQEYEVRHFSRFKKSPAESLALRACADLIDEGKATTFAVAWDDRVVAAFPVGGDFPVAFIAWRYVDWLREAYIVLGATAFSHRRRGIYRMLFNALAEKVRQEYPDATEIVSGYNPANEPSRLMQQATGRTIHTVVTTFQLHPGMGGHRAKVS